MKSQKNEGQPISLLIGGRKRKERRNEPLVLSRLQLDPFLPCLRQSFPSQRLLRADLEVAQPHSPRIGLWLVEVSPRFRDPDPWDFRRGRRVGGQEEELGRAVREQGRREVFRSALRMSERVKKGSKAKGR